MVCMDYPTYSMVKPISKLGEKFDSLSKTMFVLVKKFHDLKFPREESYMVGFSFSGRLVVEAARMYKELTDQKIAKIHCECWIKY